MRSRSSEQEDHLLRVIREAAEAIRRLRELLTGSAVAGVTVRAELGAAIDRLLGPEAPLLRQVDPATAVRLMNDPRRLELWVAALDLEADALASLGQITESESSRRRASALRAAASATG